MRLELKLDDCLLFALDDPRVPAPLFLEVERLRAALAQVKQAIEDHQVDILGPEYDYENDPAYLPEAKLYRILPVIEAALKPQKMAENQQKTG